MRPAIGFTVGDGWAGVDLDEVQNPAQGEMTEAWATGLLSLGGYSGVSLSGLGLKLFGRGTWQADWHRKLHPRGGEVEESDTRRYFTVCSTGRSAMRATGSPATTGGCTCTSPMPTTG